MADLTERPAIFETSIFKTNHEYQHSPSNYETYYKASHQQHSSQSLQRYIGLLNQIR